MGDCHAGIGQYGDVGVIDPHAVGGQHPATEHPVFGQDPYDARPVFGLQCRTLHLGLGYVQV